jgi:hypothetical protein
VKGIVPPPGGTGPGGCTTEKECDAFCKENPEECRKFCDENPESCLGKGK